MPLDPRPVNQRLVGLLAQVYREADPGEEWLRERVALYAEKAQKEFELSRQCKLSAYNLYEEKKHQNRETAQTPDTQAAAAGDTLVNLSQLHEAIGESYEKLSETYARHALGVDIELTGAQKRELASAREIAERRGMLPA